MSQNKLSESQVKRIAPIQKKMTKCSIESTLCLSFFKDGEQSAWNL